MKVCTFLLAISSVMLGCTGASAPHVAEFTWRSAKSYDIAWSPSGASADWGAVWRVASPTDDSCVIAWSTTIGGALTWRELRCHILPGSTMVTSTDFGGRAITVAVSGTADRASGTMTVTDHNVAVTYELVMTAR